MQNIILYLGIIALLPLLIHRVLFLIEGKKPSFNTEPVGTLLVIIYFGLLHFRIITIAEIGIFILMLYGFIVNKPVAERLQQIIIGITILALVLVFIFFTSPGLAEVIECIAAIFLVFGNYALNNKRKPAGWALFSLCSFCTAYVVYARAPSHQLFIHAQIFLATICLIGFAKRR